MTDRNYGLMRIFWPSNAPSDDIPGVVIGWRNGELDVLVVGILQGVDVRKEQDDFRTRPQLTILTGAQC
jgi:phosphatidylinositol glycan class Q protein